MAEPGTSKDLTRDAEIERNRARDRERGRRRRAATRSYLIRAPKDVAAEIDRRVEASGLSLNAYALAALLRGRPPAALRRALPPDPEERTLLETLLFQLRKAGVNLNQLAQRQNSAAYSDADVPVDAELREAARAVTDLVLEIEKRL
jgi:hypothetical protein